MSRPEHVAENVPVLALPLLEAGVLEGLFA
jgi:hypothetical protein